MYTTGAIDDSQTLQQDKVEGIVRRVCVSYSHLRFAFRHNERQINDLLNGGHITEAIQFLTKVFGLPNRFVERVGYSAKIDVVALLRSEFCLKEKRVTGCRVFFQNSKEELLATPRYRLFHIIAHELSHARMQKDMHSLRTSEFATDVLAILVTGDIKGYEEHISTKFRQFGYIRPELREEVFRCLAKYADKIYLP